MIDDAFISQIESGLEQTISPLLCSRDSIEIRNSWLPGFVEVKINTSEAFKIYFLIRNADYLGFLLKYRNEIDANLQFEDGFNEHSWTTLLGWVVDYLSSHGREKTWIKHT